ncbi:MAG: hypothetical protein B6I34_03645 [Anaerolineaceae bacterium 4572_32.1]|nr:MAG: hypothetical protein B6I34_03645 [Anaerolineaceae bacterium 4572_32.1]
MKTVEIDQLMRYLADEKTPLAVAQLYRLTDLSEGELARFRHLWLQIPAKRRSQVIGFLIEIAESNFEVNFEAIFCACLDDIDQEVRTRAVDGLWESEDAALIAPLLRMAQDDPAPIARAAAAAALGRFVLLGELGKLPSRRQAEIEDVLLALINSPQESVKVQRRAVEAVAYSGRKEILKIIEDAYHRPERLMRVSAVFAMGRNMDPQWNPLLLEELQNPDPEFRYEAARACGELELKSAVSQLSKLLTDSDREVQEVSIWALGQIGGEQARQILETRRETAAQDDEALREAIEDALDEIDLAAGTVEFSLYEYDLDIDDQDPDWIKDWIGGSDDYDINDDY